MAKKINFKQLGTKTLGLGIGAVGAGVLNKPLANLNPNLRAGAKIVAGALLPTFLKSPLMGNVGDGMIAVGALELGQSLVPGLSGIGITDPEFMGEIDDEYITDDLYGIGEEDDFGLNGIGEDEGPISGVDDDDLVD